jgi:hypothetical protein
LSFILKELSSEIIAIYYSEYSSIEIKINLQIQVFPPIVLGRREIRLRDFVSLEEDALRYTRVLKPFLDDVQSVIFEIVVDNALSDSEVLVWIFNDGLLEVGIELQDLFKNKVKSNII